MPETLPVPTACCDMHIDGPTGVCCDPDDCGPCCPKCPSCPTLHNARTYIPRASAYKDTYL